MLSHDYYDYQELKEKAMRSDATKEDRLALLKWFEHNYQGIYNGEHYPLEDGYSIKPIYAPVGEPDEDGDYEEWELIDAEIR